MSWRPKGWKNNWSNPDVIVKFDKNLMAMRTADGTTPERVLAEDRRDIYEAGADAMLEVRKQVEQGLLKVIDEYVRMMLRDMIKTDDD